MTLLDTLYQVLRQLDDINQIDTDELATQLAQGNTSIPPLGYEGMPPDDQVATVIAAITVLTEKLAPKLNPDGRVIISRITSVVGGIGDEGAQPPH